MISFLCDFFAYDSIYSIEKACQNSAENSCYAPGKSIAFQYSAYQYTANECECYTGQFVSGYRFMVRAVMPIMPLPIKSQKSRRCT